MDFDSEVKASVAPRQPPKSRRSILKCLGVFCAVITFATVAIVSYFVIVGVWGLIDVGRDPHKPLVYKGEINPSSSTQVVSPLIDSITQFDVAIMVTARLPNNDTSHAEEYAQGNKWNESDYTTAEVSVATLTGHFPVEVRYLPQEQVLYSGIPLHNVSLSDRNVDTQIKFKLPLKRFYDSYLFGLDVRVSIALIPTVNSKLERLEDFTDYKPEQMTRLKKVDNQLQVDTLLNHMGEDDTTRWDAVEHIALSYHLIEFHERPHPCGTNATIDDAGLDDEDLYASVRLEEDGEANALPKGGVQSRREINEKLHPFLVTRSHFYIINETRPFERKAFDAKHKTLRQTACGKVITGDHPSRFLCGGDYNTNGHWQSRFVLHPQEAGGKKELAYGPALGMLKNAAGPRDVRPLPVTRVKCPSANETITPEPDPDHIDVTYTIRFSSLSAGRVSVLDNFVTNERAAHNATEYQLGHSHSSWEAASGLFGDKANGIHPWRRFFVALFGDVIFGLAIGILSVTYWYTRTTTAGINRIAGQIGAVALAIGVIHGLVMMWSETDSSLSRCMWILLALIEMSPGYLQLRLVSPIEIKRDGRGWTVRRRVLSHRERASERKGTSISSSIWLGVFAVLLFLAYVPPRYDKWLVRPSLSPSEEDKKVNILFPAIAHAGDLLASIMQLQHNKINDSFAGQYALTAGLVLARTLTKLLYYSPTFIGRVDNKDGLYYTWLIQITLEIWAVYQATTLYKVPQTDLDVDQDNE